MLSKVLAPSNMALRQLSREEGISEAALLLCCTNRPLRANKS